MKIRRGYVSNSSSSSFVCSTKMSVDEVREKLEKMVEFLNEFDDENLTFDEIFRDPFIADEEYCGGEWADHYPTIKNSKGKIIIESAWNSSIPYEMFEFIENKFEAIRCHLG